jgi:hypothetical protein
LNGWSLIKTFSVSKSIECWFIQLHQIDPNHHINNDLLFSAFVIFRSLLETWNWVNSFQCDHSLFVFRIRMSMIGDIFRMMISSPRNSMGWMSALTQSSSCCALDSSTAF